MTIHIPLDALPNLSYSNFENDQFIGCLHYQVISPLRKSKYGVLKKKIQLYPWSSSLSFMIFSEAKVCLQVMIF